MASFVLSLVDKVTGPAGPMAGAVAKVSAGIKGLAPAGQAGTGGLASVGEGLQNLTKDALPTDGILGKVAQGLAGLGPYGVAAAAVLVVVTAAVMATVGALYKLASTAISISQEKDALNATFTALAGGAGAADAVNDSVDKLGELLPQSKDKIEPWAKSLLSAGIQGVALEESIKGIASAEAMMGAGGASAAEKMTKTLALGGEAAEGMMKQIQAGGRKSAVLLAEMGLHTADLAAALGVTPEKFEKMKLSAEQMGEALNKALIQKGAGALETMGLTWESITGKLGDAWGSMFESLGPVVQPFMAEIKSLFSEFFEGTPAVNGAGALIKAVLTEVFALATKVVHAIHYGFLTIQIAALKVAIAIAPIVLWIKALVTNAMFLKGLVLVLKAIAVVALLCALPFILMGAAIAVVIAAAVALQVAVYAAVAYIVGGLMWLVGTVDAAGPAIRDALVSWATTAFTAASNFVQGLVNGITSGAGMVIDAVKNLASGALSAFKGVLGIHSPSAVMKVQGNFVAQGAALGIDAGAGRVQAAARSMGADVPASVEMGVRGPGAQGGGGSRAGGALAVTFEKGAIQIDGAGKSAMEITEEMLALVFERLAASQGLMAART